MRHELTTSGSGSLGGGRGDNGESNGDKVEKGVKWSMRKDTRRTRGRKGVDAPRFNCSSQAVLVISSVTLAAATSPGGWVWLVWLGGGKERLLEAGASARNGGIANLRRSSPNPSAQTPFIVHRPLFTQHSSLPALPTITIVITNSLPTLINTYHPT